MALPLAAVVTAIMLTVAVAGLGMNAPHVGLLWLFAWLCAASVAAGTLVLFAVLGTPGQLAALLVFVYLGLAGRSGLVRRRRGGRLRLSRAGPVVPDGVADVGQLGGRQAVEAAAVVPQRVTAAPVTIQNSSPSEAASTPRASPASARASK